ncbi:hypothetical protein KEM54_006454 [Ascosphaera aggregata]|nr:hypothetical protein KEM54_006454 [Ascosphaera aggregata]
MGVPQADYKPDSPQRLAEIAKLWSDINVQGKEELNFREFKNGLKLTDHCLKDADHLMREIFRAVDQDQDGRIRFTEFQKFLRQTERVLRKLFDSIDKGRNGHLDKPELRKAFAAAGMKVDRIKLDEFFEQLDADNDGVITFEEWRDFLLFLPAHHSDLYSVLNYFNATGTLDAEGDVHINQPSNGLGTTYPLKSFASSSSTSPYLATSLQSVLQRLAYKYLQAFVTLLLGIQEPMLLTVRTELGGISRSAETSSSSYNMNHLHTLNHLTPTSITFPHGLLHEHDATATSTTEPAHSPFHLTPDLDALDPDCAELELDLRRFPTVTVTPPPWLVDTYNSFHSYKHLLTDCSPHLGYFIAGGIAGAVSRTATAPLDRLKVYLIAQTGAQKAEPLGASRMRGVVGRAVQPFVAALRELMKAGGWKSLFAGNGLNVVKVMPESAIKFGAYEAAKRTLARVEGHDDPKKLQAGSQFLAGGLGGMVAHRMQCETVEGGLRGNRLILATLKNMWNTGGFHSFYRGLPLGLVGVFPYAAIDFFTFETLKRTMITAQSKKFHIKEQDVILSNFTTGAIGALSGALGASVVYPMNVLRTRLQAQGTVLHRMTYTGIGDVARKTYSAEGMAGFFKGLTPNLMKVIPAVSISYVVYENSKRLLKLT